MFRFTLLINLVLGISVSALGVACGQNAGPEPYLRGLNESLGFREHRAGYWSYINPEIENPTDRDFPVEVVAYFAKRQNRQYAKRLMVPARSRLTTSLPILVGKEASRSADIQVALYDLSGGEPRLLLNQRKRTYDTAISIRGNQTDQQQGYLATSLIADMNLGDDPDQADVGDLVTASRIYFNQIGRVGASLAPFLPASKRAFDSTDQIVICNDHLLNDSAGRLAIQRWLADGGDLWILLDQVQERTVTSLLGDSAGFQEIDRTSLTSVRVEQFQSENAARPPVRQFENPVALTRVVVQDATVLHTVDGWPVSFWKRVGKGRVFYTALGSRAWMRERRTGDPPVKSRLGLTNFIVTPQMEDFAYQMYSEPNDEIHPLTEESEQALVNQIGYSVLNRGTVGGILGGYTLLLFVVGMLLIRQGRLEWLFYIGPLLAILTAVVFLGIGLQNKAAAPSTVATLQLVEGIPAVNQYHVRGLGVLYSQEAVDHSLSGTEDGRLDFPIEKRSDELKKTIWDENHDWMIAPGTIQPGLEKFRFSSHWKSQQPLLARATFTELGLEGFMQVDDEVGELEDVVIATPGGRYLAATIDGRKLSASPKATLPPGLFVDSSLLSDQQRWHQQVYQSRFPTDDWEKWENRLTVYAWARPLDLDIEFPPDFQRSGGALFRIPLKLTPADPGTLVRIPPPLIDIQNVPNRFDIVSPRFQNRSRKWVGSIARESSTRLRFQLPPQVLPLKIQSATFSIQSILAPHRRVVIKSGPDAGGQILRDLDEPAQPISLQLENPELLALDDRGGIVVEIDISVKQAFLDAQESKPAMEREELTPEILNDIRLNVEGIVTEAPDGSGLAAPQ